jgi:hypothetical protein
MKNTILFAVLVFALSLFSSSCREDFESSSTSEEYSQQPVVTVTGNVAGRVVDENQQPVANARISMGALSTETDADGLFVFQDAKMNQKGTFLKVEKSGYFLGSRRFFPNANVTSYVRVELLGKTTVGTFDAAAGGQVDLSSGGSVTFAANSIKTASGAAYTGSVRVAAKWLDPTSAAMPDQMPGNLQGINSELSEVALVTYGMMAVELTGTSGELLNIADGQTAELRFPLPASIRSNAPANIPLWSFDEAKGMWVEEGSAAKQGDVYVGEVSHFSFWNCDAPFPLVEIKGCVEAPANSTAKGAPLANMLVRITYANNADAWPGYGYTDENGQFGGKVPKGEALILEILDECGEVIFSKNIGPFEADTDLGCFEVALNSNSVHLSGTLLDCNNQPVANGFVKMHWGDHATVAIYTEADGTFDFLANVCSATSFELTGIDIDELTQGETTTHNVEQEVNTNVSACGTALDEYFLINVDGEEYLVTNPKADTTEFYSATLPGNQGTFITNDYNVDSLGLYLNLMIGSIEAGEHSDKILWFAFGQETSNTSSLINIQCSNQGGICEGFTSLNIIEFGAIGQKIKGTFSGTFPVTTRNGQTTSTEDKPVSGSFSVYLDN